MSEVALLSSKKALDYWTQAANPSAVRRWKRSMVWRRGLWKTTVLSAAFLKRCLDVGGSIFALIAFSPVLLLLAILIKLEDRGPIFYKQQRYGLHGRTFYCWKIRSMVTNADALMKELLAQNKHGSDSVCFKMKEDPRITRTGKWIRKLSLDEVPQFWSVLIGDMSLVGPRPHVWAEVSSYNAFQLRRLTAKPGITCLWQIGGRSDIPFEGQVRLDLKYIHSQSVWEDIKILFLTVPAVILGRGAY
ncbi:MAG: lipopolysaccharide/colanic/teichoic acid biosynthesis glycosyltransferase [Verrucomicrobiales bacterium]|jgi:lipopolysaccharide/colanic/teichoic acid biosynthesis glycosyltransferase